MGETVHFSDPTLVAFINDAEAALARLRAYVQASEHLPAFAEASTDHWPECSDDLDLLTPVEAAQRFGGTASTMRRWAKSHGIGKPYGSYIRISVRRTKSFLNAK